MVRNIWQNLWFTFPLCLRTVLRSDNVAMVSEIAQVQSWLRNIKQIVVPDDWLEACIEWIIAENEGPSLSSNDISCAVFEQWLVADLNEIGASCLPLEAVTSEKFVLSGCYGLQVSSLVDVSHSFYSQLQKITGADNENVRVTSTQRPDKADPSGSRMLMLELTDGAVQVKGMEYQSIACLSLGLPPGTKILIRGPLLCRHGVLMLKSENVAVLGGEVDTLVESSRQEAVVSNRLGSNIPFCENRPDLPRMVFEGGDQKVPPQQLGNSVQSRHFSSLGETKKPFVGFQRESVTSACLGSLAGTRASSVIQPEVKIKAEGNCEFPDDDDDIFLDSVMEIDDISQRVQTSRSSSSGACLANSSNSSLSKVTASETSVGWSKNSGIAPVVGPRNQPVSEHSTSFRNETKPVTNNQVAESKTVTESYFDDDFDISDFEVSIFNGVSNGKPCLQPNVNYNNNMVVGHSSGQQSKSAASNQSQVARQQSSETNASNQITCRPNIQVSVGHASSLSKNAFGSRICEGVDVSVDREGDSRHGANYLQPDVTNSMSLSSRSTSLPRLAATTREHQVPSIKSEVSECSNNSMRQNEIKSDSSLKSAAADFQQHISSLQSRKSALSLSINGWNLDSNTDVAADKPFTYLCRIISRNMTSSRNSFHVKAYISTLLSRLEHNDGQYWSLTVKINDGTAALDAVISNEMLSSLIGFTAADGLKIKENKVDKVSRQCLTEGIRRCQETLTSLSAVLEIEFAASPISSGNCQLPVIRRYRTVTLRDVDVLKQRIVGVGVKRSYDELA